MKIAQLKSHRPAGSADHLGAVDSGLPLFAYLSTRDTDGAARGEAESALGPIYGGAAALDAAIKANPDGVQQLKGGRLKLSAAGRAKAQDTLGVLAGRGWAELKLRGLVALSLGLDPKDAKTGLYLARRENLESAALGRLYGVTAAGAMPTRTQFRYALLRALIVARMPECEAAFPEIPMQNTSRDVVGRAVMLGAAGLAKGTMRDAEAMLLRKALGLTTDDREELVEALIRASLGRNTPSLPARIRIESAAQELTGFAKTVRDLAKTLQTAPFEGRVAIAQVYDAGVAGGLNFGTLEEFKSRVVAACRGGLLDLERYDIAGSMDGTLRERSRTAFGRDERHFIVNEWI
jgi:hypothetical protein